MILTHLLGAALTARASLPDLVASRGHPLLVRQRSWAGPELGGSPLPAPTTPASEWAVSGRGDSIRKAVSAQGCASL